MLHKIIQGHVNANKAKKGKLPPKDVQTAKARLAVCHACDILDKRTMKCDKKKGGCGCTMTKKVYCKTCKCPKGKW